MNRAGDKFLVGDGCWDWTAGKDRDGYGVFSWPGGTKAHRYMYELMVGPIPVGLTLDHLCRNTGCVRPDHLDPCPSVENSRRGTSFDNLAAEAARNAAKTHCPQGHPYSGDNLYTRPSSSARVCRECGRESTRRYLSKRGA